ncbi:hypothetical protein MUK42_03201 [Musa troglodytarum]|uniref:AUGMIN subunit 8 n=1 Tax=Musa troglodytarum TaxID=320322 RepID=A0A9E7HLV4_9LILI|nr:hypothetical protein MUK42_03201 [Musa troglodytarum]
MPRSRSCAPSKPVTPTSSSFFGQKPTPSLSPSLEATLSPPLAAVPSVVQRPRSSTTQGGGVRSHPDARERATSTLLDSIEVQPFFSILQGSLRESITRSPVLPSVTSPPIAGTSEKGPRARRRVRSPKMVAAIPAATAATPTATTRPQVQKKIPNPSPRRRDPICSARPPLSLSEKNNAVAPKRPHTKEMASRHLASYAPSSSCTSVAKCGSFRSASASSSSKCPSFASSSCYSASTVSSSSSSTGNSSHRRSHSPLPTPRPSTPVAVPRTCMPSRSKSVDRTRPTDTAIRHATNDPTELSSAAARVLRTTTRSLSVSFQGESFSYQTSKVRNVSPSPNRRPTPERRGPVTPAATPARSSFKSESARPFDNHHRWPGTRTQQLTPLTRSLDCSIGEKDSVLAAMRSLRHSIVLNEGARRASFDGGDLSLSFDIDSSSSGGNSVSHERTTLPPRGRATARGIDVPSRFLQEKGHRLHRLSGPGMPQPSPGLKSTAPCKLVPAKKSPANGLLSSPASASSTHRGSFRPSSPSKLTAASPRGIPGVQQVTNSLVTSSPIVVSLPVNAASIFNFTADIKRGKIGERRIKGAHQLRLLYNRLLQWRWVNAQANDNFLAQKLDDEITYLEQWSLVDQDHSSTLLGAIEALKASTICLPIVNGAKADFHEMRNAISSAVDVMQAIGTSIWTILSKVERKSYMVSELADLATKEQALMDQCRNLLTTVSAMHVKQCSLLGHITQLSSPSLIQL